MTRIFNGVPRALLATAVLLIALVATSGEVRATPARTQGPEVCTMGAYIISLSQVDTATGTFRADFWMWSLCPRPDMEPLKTLEFLNGVQTSASLDSSLRRGDRWWATRKFSGIFRQDFSLKNYPFDEQPLVIDIEEGVLDSRELIYIADKAESGMDPSVELPGWRLKDFHVISQVTEHPTTYGDPSLPGDTSRYASLRLQVGVERAHIANFIKATFPLYIAVMLALVALLVTDGRMSLLGATMFAVVLSFVSVERVVGPHDGVYLLDQLHFATLALIMAATGCGVISLRRVAQGMDPALQRRRDAIAAGCILATFVVLNVVLIALAVVDAGG